MADKFSDSMRCFSDWVKVGQQKTNNTCTSKIMDHVSTPNKQGPSAKATFSQTVVMGGTTPFALEKRAAVMPLPPLTLKRLRPYSDSTTVTTDDDESKQNQNQNQTQTQTQTQTHPTDLTIPKSRCQVPTKTQDGPSTEMVVAVSNTDRVDFARSATPPGIPRMAPTASTLVDTPASEQEQKKEDGDDVVNDDGKQQHVAAPAPSNGDGNDNDNGNGDGEGDVEDHNRKTLKAQTTTTAATTASRPAAALQNRAATYSHPAHTDDNHSRRIAALESQLAASEHAQLLGMAKIRSLLAEAKAATAAGDAAEARARDLQARLDGDAAAYSEKGELLRHAEKLLGEAEEKERALWGALERRDGRIEGLKKEVESLKQEVEELKKGGDQGEKEAMAEELKALREENAGLKAQNEEARRCEEKNVAQFESLRDYLIDMEAQSTESERLVEKVHKLGKEQYERAEALQAECGREREAREEAVKLGMQWKKLAEKRGEGKVDGAQVVREAVVDRIYNNLCGLVEEFRGKGPEAGGQATLQTQNGSAAAAAAAAAGSQPLDVDMTAATGN